MPGSPCDMDSDCENNQENKEIYFPNKQNKNDLSVDESAYEYLEQLETESSFLSFDIISLSDASSISQSIIDFYFVSGTQVEGKIVVNKISGVHPLDVDDFDSEYEKPKVSYSGFSYRGGINRIRYADIEGQNIIASWFDTGFVGIWDVSKEIENLSSGNVTSQVEMNLTPFREPIIKTRCHKVEGFAIDWCKLVPKRLASGDQNGNISIFSIDQPESVIKLNINSSSIEDLQWSNQEADVLASCGCDSTVRIWDTRSSSNKSVTHVKASTCDINVISWSKLGPFILSGDDNGVLNVWDLRKFGADAKPAAYFQFHKSAITSVEWHPFDVSCFAASSDDHSITQWDLTAEPDPEKIKEEPNVPPQLLFIHMCSNEPKELHWHPCLPGFISGVTQDTFEIFKTISV